MSRTEYEMQNIDERLLHSIFHSLDVDDWSNFKKALSYQQHKDFFQKYIKDNKNNSEFSTKIHIKKVSELPNQYSLYFDLNEINFYICYQNTNEEEAEREKEIFSKTKSKFILHPEIFQTKEVTYYQYLNGTTIHQLIKRNQKEHIIEEADKLLWCLEICYAMSDLYNENNDTQNYNFYHGNISDETFFIDSMKNVYLINTKPNQRHQYFKCSETNIITENSNDINAKKKEDIYSCGILFEEILKEKLPNDETFTNGSIQWYRNNHNELDKILNKFPSKRNIYTEFKQIIHDLKSTYIYKCNKDKIEARLNNTSIMSTTKCSFTNLIFSQIVRICDINLILRELMIKLRDQTEKGSDYYLFFNLILHVFSSNNKKIERKMDFVEILNLFNVFDDLQNSIDTILTQYLPNEYELNQIKQNIIHDFGLNEQEIAILNQSKEIIKAELKGKDDDHKNLLKLLQKIYIHYFPCSNDEKADEEEIFDYFGIFHFLKYKNDLLHIVYPTINEKSIERLNKIPNDANLKSFLTKTNSYMNKFCVLDFADTFDSSHQYNRLFYSVKNSCFYLNRKFHYDEFDIYEKMVKYQDELFSKIDSKYILHLDADANHIKHDMKSSSLNIQFVPTTLLHLIRKNDKHKIINDSDKILWAIQIATAFRDLQNYQNEYQKQNKENFVDFKSCIYDQSFFVDSMKNVYLGTLAYCTEHEMDDAVTTGPLYFRFTNESSYIYTFGVLLNEIITEIEPKNLFGNKSRNERKEILTKGYCYFDKFNELGIEWYEYYGYDIKTIVDKCIKNEIDNFDDIIDLLKSTKLYKKNKYIVDKREEEAQRIDWNRKSTFRTLLLSEITGICDMSNVFQQLFKALNEYCDEDEYLPIYDDILKELNISDNPINHFQVIEKFIQML